MRRRPAALVLTVALGAAGLLLLRAPDDGGEPAAGPALPPALPAARLAVADAWPAAERGVVKGTLPGGGTFVPVHFLDPRTALGTAYARDGKSRRLVLTRTGGPIRELRKLPPGRNAVVESAVSSGTHVVWAESGPAASRIWVADLRDSRSPARLLTADTGATAFTGGAYDLVIQDGRVIWAATGGPPGVTEIRSVPITGGAVAKRTEKGSWFLSAWPWLTDGSDQTSVARLRDLGTNRDTEITGSGTDLLTCGPAWCRVAVVDAGGVGRVDLMRHDGSARTTVADGTMSPVGADVTVLDRFALFFANQPVPGGDNTAVLIAYDLVLAGAVEIGKDVRIAYGRGGLLWWQAAGDWHCLDLRTV